MAVVCVSANRARQLFVKRLNGYNTIIHQKQIYTKRNYHIFKEDTVIGNYYNRWQKSCSRVISLIYDFKGGISLEEVKRLPQLRSEDLKLATPLSARWSSVIFTNFIISVVSLPKGIKYGYLQDNINIPTGGFRETIPIPMIINHTLVDGIYSIVIHNRCTTLLYFRGGLAQGLAININPLSNNITGTAFYHNGILMSQNDMQLVYTNRRLSRYVGKNIEENYCDGKAHGLFILPGFRASFEHGVLKGEVVYKQDQFIVTMTIRRGIESKFITHGALNWFLSVITLSHAIGSVTYRDILSDKIVESLNIDAKGYKHGKRIVGVRKEWYRHGRFISDIEWYWHGRVISKSEFCDLYNNFTKHIKDATGLLTELSKIITQYLH